MLKVRSRVADVPGVVWVLNRSLFIVAIMLALLVSAGVAYAQGTPTVPTIESVAVTSDPGEDGGYAIGDEIQVGLTFSEAVTVTGTPQLTLDVGGRSRTAEYSEGSTTTQLLFTYTVPSGDEDTDGIAVVTDSLALNGGAIRAGSTNATLTHADLNSADHKVDGIAPTVTVDGETRTYVPPGRQFNVVFNFSEKVYGITDDEITVTNGLAVDVRATGGTDTWPRYTRWDVIVVPAAEGPVTVTLEAGAGADAYGNGNTAPDSALEVIAATPVTVEVARTTSGFAEGGRAEFTVTRSGDNGAIPVFLSLDQTGDLLSGSVEVYPPADPNNPDEPAVPEEFTFTETPFTLNVTFAAGETRKRIAVLTEDDYRVENDGTVTLSVPARPDQYKYIPGPASSATADVRDNDVPAVVSLYWGPPFHPYDPVTELDTALEGGSIDLVVFGIATGEPLLVTLAVTEVGSYLDLDGEGARGYEDLGNGKLRVTLPVGQLIESVSIPLLENAVMEADGSVIITIESDLGRSYTPSADAGTVTIPVKDNDTPSTVSISAPDSITEGGPLSYTLTRTWAPGQSQGELSVNVELAQTGDYISWPTAHQPDADGLVTIPVNFAARSLTATLTLETVDDQMSEDNGSVTATILANADGRYVTGADSAHTTKLLDNDLPVISVAAVSAEVTEGTDAQFRFSRAGNTSVATRVGLWVGGLPKIMTDATDAIALTADNADHSQRLHIYGAWVDYILEFAAGETEKTLSLTTEADNVNEGDGLLGVTIVQRVGNLFGIGAGYAQVLVKDDDIPTVSLTQPVGPTGFTLSADGTTWEGQLGETDRFTLSSVCTGVTEFSQDRRTNLAPLALWVMYANHPAHYGEDRQNQLGSNYANVRSVGGGDCAGTVRSVAAPLVGPENGLLEIELLAQSEFVPTGSPWNRLRPKVYDDFITQYEEAARAAAAAGTLITQKGIFSPARLTSNYRRFHCLETDFRYCPKYLVGAVNKIRLTVINRDPTILIKAENSQVEEGQPARFALERLWNKALYANPAPVSTTVVSLRATQNGQYITGALPVEVTFGQNELRKVIELQTVDDGAFGPNGSLTIELLPDTTSGNVNLSGKYTTWTNWLGHTPQGGRSDRATVAIINNDDKPGITIAPASALEGDSGSADMIFTVTLAKAVTEAVTINYATSDGTAIAGRDYTAVSNGSVTIAAGNTTAEFTVSMTGDETDELDETFNVTISMPEPEPDLNGGGSGEPVAAITGGDTAAVTGTIIDDDPAVVTVAPKVDTVEEGEEVVFVLTRTGVTDEELYMLVDVEDPARRRLMIAKFDADAVTTELSVATENNDLVDYPSERDYTIHLYGDGYFGGRDDERYTPGDPDEATITVQDNDALVVVTVEPVKEFVGAGESVQFRFRRTGSIAGALTISFQGFEHPSSGDATLADASVTFLADNDTVVYTNDVTSSGTVNPISRAHTVLIYGDAGRGGLHRLWLAGDPNRATVFVAVDALGPMPVTASYPSRVAAAESVSVEYTVTNLGTRALLGYENRVSDGTRISTTPDRGNCDIRDEIPAGESRTCSASFTVTNQDVTNGKIEFNATARNHTKSSTLRVYIRVAQPVEFGFTTADTLEVTEGPDVTATLTVTRTGRLDEAVTVVYRLRPQSIRPAALGEDFTDPSSTPGLLTFPANVTSANIVINITQDQIDEERERFRVVLVPLTDGTITEGKNSRVVLIIDEHQENDPYRPTASLQLVSSGPVPESEGPVEFAIVLDREWGIDARYEVELLPDQLTATPGIARSGKKGDFEDPGVLVVRIPAGQTRFEFSIPLYDDDVREEDETFQLLLGSSIDKSFRTIGPSNTALATIADDDRIPPTEVVLSLSHNGSALESVPEGSTQQDITVTALFPQIRWPGDAANAPLRPADPRDVDTTVRVRFDPNSGATHAAGLDDFEPLEVEDALGEFQVVESFDIVIPAGQTSGTATLRFTPVKDDVDEEDETVTLLGSEVVAVDSADSLPVRSASFTIIDDDTRGITVSPASALIGLSLLEGGEPGTYSLVLDSQPTDTVVITLAGNEEGFLRIVPDTLTFTTSDWATSQTVSVMALDDGIAGGGGTQDLVTHQVSGGDYGSVTAPDILTIIEDTTKAFVYLEGGQASESDGYVEFTVTVRPILRTTPVLVRYATVDGTAIAGSDYTREVETGQTYKILNIPAGQSSATIRIPITDDQVYESADETFTLQLTNDNNQAMLDGGATSLTATGAIADDDPKPVVSVAGPAGDMSYVSENVKDPVTFTLTLVGQSAGDVTVNYATGEAGLLDLLTARQGLGEATENEDYAGTSGTVTFTSGQTTKTVTVQVTNDDVSEETEFFGFRISAPQGADLTGQRSEDVADVGLLDDDRRAVTIHPTSIGLDEPASGATAVAGSYTVNLNSKPTDTITVTIGGGAPAVSLSGNTLTNNQLTFTTTNWNTAQTITVTPVKDDNAVGETVTLTHTLSGGDYAGIAADSVTINLTDSDTRNLVLSEESLAVTEGDATGVGYTVKLATRPSDTVTVNISGHDGADLTLSGTTLTNNQLPFTTTNWGTAQTVTVKAGHDNDASNDTATLTHTASGGDYASITADLPVTVTDDDTAGVVLSETDLTVTEGDAAGTSYTVKLATQPSDTVIVTISGHNAADLMLHGTTLTNNQLTFTTTNWNTAQTVTVKAGEDDDAANDTATLTHTASGGDYASVTKNLLVTVTDDDTADIVLSETGVTVTEGDAAGSSYTVRLATEPSGSVSVSISGHDGTDLTLSGTTLSSEMLTFTVGNWDTAQTVTIKAGQDDDGANDTGTLTHAASGGDYASISVGLPVTVTDDDEAGVTIEPTTLSVVAGRSNEYTAALATEPTGDVTVTISGHAATAVTLDKTTLTFTVDNWDDAQTVTASATQNAATAKVTLAHAVAGSDYGSVTAEPVVVSVVGVAGQQPTLQVGVSELTQTLTVPEGGANSYILVLSSRPTGDVTVGVALPTGTDLSLDKTTLTFTADNWDVAQTVIATAAEDDDAVTDAGVRLTHTVSGGSYGSTTVPNVEVSITENDSAGLVISKDSLTVGEGDAAGTSYTVALATLPSGSVSVSITGHAGTDLTLDKTTLTFTVVNWATAQTVTVKAGQDDDGANDTGTLTHSASSGDYANVTKNLPVTVTDDDTAGVTIEPTALSVVAGRSNEYTVKLATEPTGDVTVTVSGHAGTDVTPDKTTLTFTVGNWDTAQTVTVSATQNAATAKVTLAHAVAGSDYGSVTAEPVVVSVVAMASVGQQPTLQVGVSSSTQTLTVPEGGANSYTLVLGSRPTGDVTIGVTLPAGTDLTLDKTTLTFTSTNWDVAQTVAVTAAEDDDGVTDVGVTLTHTVSGGGYGSTTVPDVEVSITENDTADIVLSKTSLTVMEGDAAGSSYTVKLATEPTGEVTVTVSGHAGTDLSLDKTTLTFTEDNWATAQTVTVKAGQDNDGAADTATLTHTASGGDYASVSNTLPVTVTDDDTPAVVLGKTSLTVAEGDAAGTSYTVKLATEPTGEVTVTVSGHAGTDLSLDKTTLTFTVDNWDVAQTVTVKAGQDDDAANDTATLTHTASGGDYANVTKNLPVSIIDDEVPVTVQFGATTYEVVEGETVTIAVTLSADPERTVVVPITHTPQSGADSPADYSGVPPSVTFNTGQMSQTITFTATQDDVDDDGESVKLAIGTTLPSGVSLGATNETTVSITDDDGAGVSVSEASLTIAEGSSGTYTIVLDSQPTANVTVTINDPSNTDVTAEPASLTFSSTDWNTPKTVTVNAAQDADAEDETATVTHTVTSTDSIYSGASANSVAVMVTDDEVPVTVSFGATEYAVLEGETVTVAVTLSVDPERTVVIPLTHTPQSGADSPADYSGVPPSVTFNTGQMSQTITFTAAQDDVDDDGESVKLAIGTTLPSGVSLGATNETTVSITDDDDPQVAVSFDRASYRVLEGDTVTVGVTLSGDPKRTVEIPLTATDYGGVTSVDYSGVPTSVTINAGETSKTFEFMAMADDASDTGESVMIGFGTSLPSRVTEGTPNEARVTINQMSTQFSLDCSLTATVWCADLGFSDRVAENYGWLYMRYGHGWDPPSSLSDDDFRFRGVDYDVRSMELLAGTHPVMPNAWSTWQQGYSSFRIGIYWDHRWGAPSEEHYRDWVLHLDGLELPFKDALRHGSDFVWVGAEFQQVFNDWTPSTVTKIGIKEVAAADQDTNPLLPWAPMQVDAWPEGPDRLLIVWAKPASFYPGLPDPTSYTVQWKLASADWSDSAAVSQLEVAATSNFRAVIVNGMTEDAVYSVRVIASNDAGDGPPSEETLGRPQDSLPRLIARTVNRQTLTLRFSEQLDPNAVPAATNFVVKADGGLIMVDSVAISGDEVILTLHHAVTAATHSVLVRYDKPTDPSAVFLQDTNGNYANIRQHHELLEVVNITPQSSVQPLTAQFTNMPSSHDGRTRFTFDIEFSEPVWIGDGLARDDMLEITGGTVISAPWKDRRTDKFIVHVRPDTQGDIVIVLPGHRACHGIVGSYREVPDPVAGAPCAVGSRVLTNEPTVTIPGPSSPAQQSLSNTPAEGEPRIDGSPELGQTLSADTTAIADADGLEEVVFQYQWLADDADIPGATGSTYTVVSGDVGKAIRVGVTFTDDTGNEETLTSAPITAVTAAGLQLQSATVDGGTLTLTYSEELDTGVTLGTTPFAVSVNGSSWLLIAVGVGESNVLLLLSLAVEAGDTVTVDYTAPEGPNSIRDIRGRKAASFSGQAVTNDTASAPLTASVHDAPASHDGQTAFIFELRFSEDPEPDFSYTTVRDHAFTVTGGAVTYVRRLEPGKNVRWEITVTPGSSAAVAIALNATTDCSTQGAICTEEGGKLSGGLLLVVPGPNTPATGVPTITGTARVGETLTADTIGISDGDGLNNAAFAYQWLADDAEINGATASTYTLTDADAGKAIRVKVSFTDDAGNDEQLTSAATGAVVAAPPPPPNTPATGLPTITGNAQVGETLTAGATGISDGDGLGNAAFNYQWLADDAEVNGATDSTYTLAATDAGKSIKVRVSFTDDAGNDEELTSAATGAVVAAPPPNTPATGVPTITGTARVGETLTADTTGISDGDGLDNAAFAYQWLADDAEINGATASTYTLTDADAGKAIKVRVSFTDDAGNDEQLTSAATGAVVATPPPPPNTPATGVPTITGTARVGETLTADTTGISDDDGLDNAAFAYQWLADNAEVNGATASTYTLTDADAGKSIKVRVSFTDDAGNDEELSSAATGAVAAAPPPPNTPATGVPTIIGTARVGETLTVDTTGIADDDGLDNAAFAYQWLADDAEINGANASSYTLVAADAGKAIRVKVSFTDDAGNDEELSSAATGAVAAAPPPPNTPATGVPTIIGTARVGETLTVDTTGISDGDGLDNATFAYQWLADDAEINGANASSYTLVAADAGKAIKVKVSFTDDAGNDEELSSAATGAVAAAVVKPPLTATVHNVPSSHNGQDAFIFELRFSEDPKPDFSYTTVRDHAFTVTGGSVTYVRRLEPGKNIRWEITVTPDSSAAVTIALNATTDCEAGGAICTEDGRMLSDPLELTVNGPGQ